MDYIELLKSIHNSENLSMDYTCLPEKHPQNRKFSHG